MKKDVNKFKKISEEIIDESAEFLSIDFPKRKKYLLEIFEKREELIKMYEELEEPKEQKKSNGAIIYEAILNEKDIEYLEHIAEVIFGNELLPYKAALKFCDFVESLKNQREEWWEN